MRRSESYRLFAALVLIAVAGSSATEAGQQTVVLQDHLKKPWKRQLVGFDVRERIMKRSIYFLLTFSLTILEAWFSVDCSAAELENLLTASKSKQILLVLSEQPDKLEEFAASELSKHIEKVTGTKPEIQKTGGQPNSSLPANVNQVVLGRQSNHRLLKGIADHGFFKPNEEKQGYSLRIAPHPESGKDKTWIAVLCGADPRGVLYAVRDFCHYHFYQEGQSAVLNPAQVSTAPRLKVRILEESGFNLFSAKNDYKEYLHRPGWNIFSRDVVFNKHYFVDWCSEWKLTHINLLWCNFDAYEEAFTEFHKYANSRGIKVMIDFVPYRPQHEGPPPEVTHVVQPSREGDCPRDPKVKKWYQDRLRYLITRKPQIDGIMIESQHVDGIVTKTKECIENPVSEQEILNDMLRIVRETQPDMFIELCTSHPVPDAATAKTLADKYPGLTGPRDWHMNCIRDRESRRRWHDLGPKFGSYLRTFRSALRSKDIPAEIDFLFNDFKMAAERGVFAYEWCYRFYGGNFGSFRVEKDPEIRQKYPDRLGPFAFALVAEAAFDPFITGKTRYEKIAKIHAQTIPDYPRVNGKFPPFPLASLKSGAKGQKERVSELAIVDKAARPVPSRLFRDQYGFHQPGEYLLAGTCVDLDNDGSREFAYSSRKTRKLHLIRAADGQDLSSTKVPGDHQSVSVHDLDGEGTYEILYATSGPGRLYVIDSKGHIINQADMGDWKTGNTPVIFDADGDGILDGYFGTRTHSFARMNMKDLSITKKIAWPGQCACHTTAMDVDGDGRWDLFAAAGDDGKNRKGMLHRLDPITLESLWSHKVEDNASSSDAVLVDIDGDGLKELLKSVDGTHNTDAKHDAVYAFETDGTKLWQAPFQGMDTPNAADLDHDGHVEIVGMTMSGELYCLDSNGKLRWKKDLRPELDVRGRCTVAPIICDLDGDRELEILAVTNGAYFTGQKTYGTSANGILFAVSAEGEILDKFDVGSPRAWMDGSYDITVCNVDDDPYLELILSGSDHVDVIETRGFGPNTEVFQPRRSYQRSHVLPWAYEDSYFIYRGLKEGVKNLTDNLVLQKTDDGYRSSGRFVTELLTLPPSGFFDHVKFDSRTPSGTKVTLNILDRSGKPLLKNVNANKKLKINQPVKLEFTLSSSDGTQTPILDEYRLSFDRLNP